MLINMYMYFFIFVYLMMMMMTMMMMMMMMMISGHKTRYFLWRERKDFAATFFIDFSCPMGISITCENSEG